MTDNGYHRWIHRFGISSSLLLLVAMTAFPVAISFVYGIWPDFKALWPGFVAVILFMAPYWPAETIGYMSVMGPGALYMSYITGNVTNLRMPATIGTINSLGIKPNTEECHTMAIIACGASVITTVYDPAGKPLYIPEASPLLLGTVPLNAKVNGATPAVGVIVIVPSDPKLHVASVFADVNAGVTGVVTSTVLVVAVQLGV